jgi:gamma-glutamyltranspeptidase/glutathione hydrolase
MNNEMDDFSTSPGTPNFFGLIGGEANAIAAGKRPLSSMSPTMVLDPSGNPRLTCGAAGGPRIISAVLQCIVRVLDLGMNVEQALAELRVHHQWSPDQLLIEPQWGAGVVAELQSRGHQLADRAQVGVGQAIEIDRAGRLIAASDPRSEGIAAWAACR